MEKIDWSDYKFRASGVSNIMSGSQGLSETQEKNLDKLETQKTAKKKLTVKQQELYNRLIVSEMTEKERKTFDDLENKMNEVVGVSDKQQDTINELIYKRDNLELSSGAETFLKKLYRDETYKRRRELKGQYIEKGNTNEEQSITLVSIVDDYVYENNKDRLYNDWLTGEADIRPVNNKGLDVKSSWDLSTFPFPDEPLDVGYYYQNLSYIDLYEADSWETVYALTNLSDSMLQDQLYREGFNWDNNIIPDWKKLEIINRFIYDEKNFIRLIQENEITINAESSEKAIDIFNNFVEIPLEKRLVRKTTVRDDEKIDLIHKMVELGRVFLQGLDEIM